ncbi:SigE family RNA polymerase sigma factor [Phycicoccus flavus]|uniref:hypothetical protein n=1 Tax=Phycicoccus flavus TaxID=2502783 RepID=UPI00197CA5AD|nr:hypothetical protein [Phycicoccus flavus]
MPAIVVGALAQQRRRLARLEDMAGTGVLSRDRVSAFAAEHGDGLLRFAYLLTGGRTAEAEDLVQTVLLRMLERDLGGIESLASYARRALVNEQHSRGRHESVGRRVLHRVWRPEAVPDPDVADRVVVLEALRGLGERERRSWTRTRCGSSSAATGRGTWPCRCRGPDAGIHKANPGFAWPVDPCEPRGSRMGRESRDAGAGGGGGGWGVGWGVGVVRG